MSSFSETSKKVWNDIAPFSPIILPLLMGSHYSVFLLGIFQCILNVKSSKKMPSIAPWVAVLCWLLHIMSDLVGPAEPSERTIKRYMENSGIFQQNYDSSDEHVIPFDLTPLMSWNFQKKHVFAFDRSFQKKHVGCHCDQLFLAGVMENFQAAFRHDNLWDRWIFSRLKLTLDQLPVGEIELANEFVTLGDRDYAICDDVPNYTLIMSRVTHLNRNYIFTFFLKILEANSSVVVLYGTLFSLAVVCFLTCRFGGPVGTLLQGIFGNHAHAAVGALINYCLNFKSVPTKIMHWGLSVVRYIPGWILLYALFAPTIATLVDMLLAYAIIDSFYILVVLQWVAEVFTTYVVVMGVAYTLGGGEVGYMRLVVEFFHLLQLPFFNMGPYVLMMVHILNLAKLDLDDVPKIDYAATLSLQALRFSKILVWNLEEVTQEEKEILQLAVNAANAVVDGGIPVVPNINGAQLPPANFNWANHPPIQDFFANLQGFAFKAAMDKMVLIPKNGAKLAPLQVQGSLVGKVPSKINKKKPLQNVSKNQKRKRADDSSNDASDAPLDDDSDVMSDGDSDNSSQKKLPKKKLKT